MRQKNRQITKDDLKENTFFWYAYICWFRGYDDIKEISIDEVLEVIKIDKEELSAWNKEFFMESKIDEAIRFINWELNEDITLLIEFQEYEIVFFLNDLYIGNLGGHFEAWFLTWNELLTFQQFEYLFLLLLPMTGVEKHQNEEAEILITNHLKVIPKFEDDAEYIAKCITNGLIIDGHYYNQNEIGIVNDQNHSVRNIEKYPRYKEEVIELNSILGKFIEKK